MADRPVRHLLVVEGDDVQPRLVEGLITGDDARALPGARQSKVDIL